MSTLTQTVGFLDKFDHIHDDDQWLKATETERRKIQRHKPRTDQDFFSPRLFFLATPTR